MEFSLILNSITIISRLDKDMIVLFVNYMVHGTVQLTWNEMSG